MKHKLTQKTNNQRLTYNNKRCKINVIISVFLGMSVLS